jgi:glycosyltransferase involved in cell wall biosynthesis
MIEAAADPLVETQQADDLPLVSIIIPVRNDAQRLQRCLESVIASRYPADRMEILVADNGSTDGSADVARAMGAMVLSFPQIRVSEVRNQAATAARGRILIFVDADHELDAGWVPHGVESLRSSGAGAVGAAYYAPPDGTWVQRMYDSFRLRTPGLRHVEWLGSGSLAVWRDVFHQVGGFDSSLETCEDVDFCQRLRRGKHKLYSDDRLRSVHLGDPRNLRALFFGELWRGRDNLRVSLRGPFTWRSLPSVVIPIANLLLAVVTIAGLLRFDADGLRIAGLAVGGMAVLALLRMGRMLMRMPRIELLTIPRAFLVAIVYEISRSLALVVRTPHRVRQSASLSKRAGRRQQA